MNHFLTFIFWLITPLVTGAASTPLLQGKDVLTQKSVEMPAQQTVVVFMSAICPCSNSHIQEIAKLAKDYPEFRFVGVHSNLEEDQATTKEYFLKAKLPFPVIEDAQQNIANRYKALKTPHAFVHNDKGDILYRGGVSDSTDCSPGGRLYLREALEDIKHQRPVKTVSTRVLGCSISR